jgi:8-oxo-dGTP diphosphatase
MTLQVALAMLQREGRWLLQLRDDIPGIVAPGLWGLFGGHLEPGEAAEQALRRELLEEIGWQPPRLSPWFVHADSRRIAHFFHGPLLVPLSGLHLQEGQDMALASFDELRRGTVWSPRLGQSRALAESLRWAVAQLQRQPLPLQG